MHAETKTLGIIGGMGPEATVDLQARIIRATPARDDADHLRVLVDNNPRIPSRIAALIEGTGTSPLPALIATARGLVAAGADFLVMPCNTAHHYHAALAAAVPVPLLDMVALTVDRVQAAHGPGATVGLLASTAVIKTDLYGARCAQQGLRLICPEEDPQAALMAAIRRIKTGCLGAAEVAALEAAGVHLARRGAAALVVACTELSLLTDRLRVDLPCHDAAQVLAEAAVAFARGR